MKNCTIEDEKKSILMFHHVLAFVSKLFEIGGLDWGHFILFSNSFQIPPTFWQNIHE
jgi:hypothetical protein